MSMEIAHETTLWLSKTVGLLYLVALSVAVGVYAYWPGNQKRFDDIARSILVPEDTQ